MYPELRKFCFKDLCWVQYFCTVRSTGLTVFAGQLVLKPFKGAAVALVVVLEKDDFDSLIFVDQLGDEFKDEINSIDRDGRVRRVRISNEIFMLRQLSIVRQYSTFIILDGLTIMAQW